MNKTIFLQLMFYVGNGRSIGIPQYNGTNRTQVYARSTARARAQERYREISERRLRRRMLGRRQALVSQIEELRNARDYLIDIDRRNTSALIGRGNGPEAAIPTPEQLGQGNNEASVTSSLGTSNLEQEVTNTYNDTNRQDGAQNRESRAETRAIDDWARARRRRLESYRRRNLQSDSYQIRRSYNHFGALNNALNRRHATNRDNNQTNTHFETNRSREQGNITETHNQITAETVDNSNNTELSSRIIEPEVVALPESSSLTTMNSRPNSNLDVANEGSSDGHIHEWSLPNTSLGILDNDDNSHNDHTYSNLDTEEVGSLRSETRSDRVERNSSELSIQTDDIQTDDSGIQSNEHSLSDVRRDASDITLPGGSTENNSAASRSNLDIILLSRHIDHMQRICRASLADCALNRHRRQVVRLQSIRRMLEDLQRQIRCLRAASNEELSRRSREAENLGSVLGSVRQRGTAEIDSHSTNLDSARSSMNTSPNYALTDDIVNHERDNEEEGHFDLIDEDAYNDEQMPIERNSDSRTTGHNDASAPDLLPVSYRTTNRPQPARRVNSSNYQLRSRTCNRISRNTSSRLRRNVGQQPALTTPRIYRYPGRYSHIPANSSSGTTSAVTIPLRSSHRTTETTAPNFDSGSSARRYYRGSHLRVSRRSNSNSANSLPLTTEPRTSALSRRTRLARTHNQLFSHLRSTVRAIEINPAEDKNKSERCNEAQGVATKLSIKKEERNRDDTKNQNINTSTIGKKATKLLQIKNSSNKHCSGTSKSKSLKNDKSNILLTRSTKEELRALSQRLERLLKEKRENQPLEIGTTFNSGTNLPSSTSNVNSEQTQQMNETMTEGERYLLSLPRPDPRLSSPNGSSLSDPRLRWRHLMEGIDEHILNDPMPPRRSVRYGVQRHNSSHYREQDFYVRQNYRSQRRDSSPLTGRNRTSRPTHPSFSLVDGTLPSIELGTDSGSDTDDPNLNSNESREFPHNSSLEWNGGTSSSPLFRHGFGRWPVRRMSRREELMDISGFGRNLNRNQVEYASLLSPNRNYENEELEERWREDRRRIRNRASARLSRMRQLERTTAYDYSAENNSVENNPNPDDVNNRSYREYLARARSPVTTAYNPSSADAGPSNNELPSDNQDIGININTDPATLDIDRLPPLRELIWRRLRRRNAQLNMLENEIAGTRNHTRTSESRSELDRNLLNQENNESSSNGNSVGRDINRPHREFLTWMVDQMRLDHESNTTHSSVRRSGQSDQIEGMANNSLNEEDTEQASGDPSTRHISFSREFITPPPIQYRHRYTNLQENNDDTNVSLNDRQSNSGSRTVRQEEESRPTSYAAAAVNGLIARNSISGSNAANNAQTNATAATFQREHYYLHNAPANMLLTHRIQSWDFHKDHIPDLRDSSSNLVVNEARIHNDASVDISEDGSILVTLIPSNMPMTTVVGVYGLKPDINRGRCYAHFR